MGVIQKQSIRSTIYNYLGIGLGFVSTAILLPRFLTTDQNGLLKLLVAFSTMFATFANLGFNYSTIKFFPYFRNKDNKHNGFLALVILVVLAGYILFVLFFIPLRPQLIAANLERSSLFATYINYVFPLTLFYLLFNAFDAFYRVIYQSTRGVLLRDVVLRVLVFGSILTYVFDWVAFPQFLFIYICALVTPTLMLIAMMMWEGHFAFRLNLKSQPAQVYRDIAKVSLIGLLTGFSIIAVTNIDSIIVNYLTDISMTGIYAITSYFGVLVVIPSRAFLRIGGTFVADAFKDNDIAKIGDIYYKSCLNQLIVGVLILVGLWINIEAIFEILPPEYVAGKYVILFIGLAHLFNMAGGANQVIIANSNFYHYSAILAIVLLLVTVVANFSLIPRWGITGAAMATAISIFVFNFLKFVVIMSKLKLQPYDLKHLLVLIVAITSYFLSDLVPVSGNIYIDIPLRSFAVVALFVPAIYFLRLSKEINNLIDKYLVLIGFKK